MFFAHHKHHKLARNLAWKNNNCKTQGLGVIIAYNTRVVINISVYWTLKKRISTGVSMARIWTMYLKKTVFILEGIFEIVKILEFYLMVLLRKLCFFPNDRRNNESMTFPHFSPPTHSISLLLQHKTCTHMKKNILFILLLELVKRGGRMITNSKKHNKSKHVIQQFLTTQVIVFYHVTEFC